jgi:NAD(P)-dependent dehydrogenase (short-subunit alcohol dehydrogenase family)
MTPVPKLFDLTGRTALITGGSKGLGLALTNGFAAAGAYLIVSSRHEDELRDAVAEISSYGSGQVTHCVADMTRREDVKRLARTAATLMGYIDILVNNAGANLPQAADEITDDFGTTFWSSPSRAAWR